MPNKTVSGWTQVPVLASDILQVTHRRLNAAGTTTDVIVTYQVRDSIGAVRFNANLTFQGGAYPVSGASILAACNAAQGT
jgi:hypothetical protein